MRYVAGIDGGQSGTQAVVADEHGRILGTGNAGPADENWQGSGSTRMHDALKGALDEARENAHLPAGTTFAAIVAGVSGYEGRLYGAAPALPAERFSLVHDPAIAHAGAFRGGSGVVVIAGTGSIAYVVDDDGCTGIEGGLGYVFGDEGSAFWIAKTAIATAISVNVDCAVERAAKEFFGKKALRDIFAAFNHRELGARELASFARVVVDLSQRYDGEDGYPDLCAREAVDDAQSHLARLAESANDRRRWHWTKRPRAAFVGGLTQNEEFKRELYDRLRSSSDSWRQLFGPDAYGRAGELLKQVPSSVDLSAFAPLNSPVEIVEPAYSSAYGAAILALREAGIACDRLTE